MFAVYILAAVLFLMASGKFIECAEDTQRWADIILAGGTLIVVIILVALGLEVVFS